MKAIIIDRHLDAAELKLRDTGTPEITSATGVRVKLKAAGVNPLDTKLRGGAYPLQQFPLILGCDGAGVVDAVGAGVEAFKPGDAVYFFHGGVEGIDGNYAEYAVVDARFLAHKPERLDFIHAAAGPVVLLTAWESLYERLRLQAGQTLFINAGAGGVGHVAIQLAKHIGARSAPRSVRMKRLNLSGRWARTRSSIILHRMFIRRLWNGLTARALTRP